MTQADATVVAAPLLSLDNVRKHYPVSTGGAVRGRSGGRVRAIDGVTLRVRQGETYALVGESGSGKTTTARIVLLAEAPTSGSVEFEGIPIRRFNRDQLRQYRASVSAVFQDPWSSLNPRMRVGDIIAEPLTTHRHLAKSELTSEVAALLEEVGLHPSHADYYPHEFSGGQRQRIAIARALSLRPRLIVLDEPVSALDVSIRAQIMNLLKSLQRAHGMSYLLIAHDLATVRYLSHRVGVMYLGKIVEEGASRELFANPLHPYTKALISAALPTHPDLRRDEIVLRGEIPSPVNPPSGCPFHPRCPVAFERCPRDVPVLVEARLDHAVSCHLFDGDTLGSADRQVGDIHD